MVGVEVVVVVLQLEDMVVGEDFVVVIVDMVQQALVSVVVVMATMLVLVMVL